MAISAIIRVERPLPAEVSIHVFGHPRVRIQDPHLGRALQAAHARCKEEGWTPLVEHHEEICNGSLHDLLRESRTEFLAWAVEVIPWPGAGCRIGKCPSCGTTIVEPEPSGLIRRATS